MPTFFKRGLAVFGAITVLGLLTLGSLKIGTSGTTIDGHFRTTASVNADSIAANGSTTTVMTLTGAGTADHCDVDVTAGDLLSTTSTARVACRITATNTATVYYFNTSSTAAFDAGTSTLSVQAWSY